MSCIQKEPDARCYASATAYAMMIPTCDVCSARFEEAHTLPELVLAVWSLARVLAIHLVESVLAQTRPSPDLLAPLPAMWGMHAQ